MLRKIGINRNKKRLWLEGKVLLEAGFNHKESYIVTQLSHGLYIELTPLGNRHVAGSVERPIIDINSDNQLSMFQAGDMVHVDYVPETRTLTISKQITV